MSANASAFAGKRVFISGGSSGIGRALALQLAQQGAHVCVAARGMAALDEVVEEMRDVSKSSGATLIARTMDVTDAVAVEAVAAEAVTALGGIDLLLCVQGYAKTGLVHEMDVTQFSRLMQVNFLGHAYLCRAFAPHFVARKSGNIMMVSSVLGYLSAYGYAAYSASKWAIVGFAEGLRQELGLHGVQVKVAYPGTTETPGLEQENADKPKVVWELESNNAFNKTRSAKDVARRILKAVQHGGFENPLGWDAQLTFFLARHMPWLVRMISDGDLRKALAKHGPN